MRAVAELQSTPVARTTVDLEPPFRIFDRLFLASLICVSDVLGRTITAIPPTALTLIWTFVDLLTLVGLYRERRALMTFARAEPKFIRYVFVLMLSLPILSTIWSDQPLLSIRGGIGNATTTMAAFYFASRLGLKGCVQTIAFAIGFEGAYSLYLAFNYPNTGLMTTEYIGAWKGMFNHKNTLAQAMDVGLISIVCVFSDMKILSRLLLGLSFIVESVCLFNTQGAAALASLAVTLVVSFILIRSRASGSIGVAARISMLVISLIPFALIFGLGDVVLGLLGRDSTFTGRTDIWQFAIQSIFQRPIFGYGYRAFWTGAGLAYAHDSSAWQPPHAHNGYLEVALNVGIVGLAVLLIYLVETFRRVSSGFWKHPELSLYSVWPFSLVTFSVIANLSEPHYEYYRSVQWLLVNIAFFAATAMAREPQASVTRNAKSTRHSLLSTSY